LSAKHNFSGVSKTRELSVSKNLIVGSKKISENYQRVNLRVSNFIGQQGKDPRIMNKQYGFTIIELTMVIMLVAILAVVAIPQFVDFRTEAKNAATQSALGALRTGIVTQINQEVLRCAAVNGTLPTAAQVNANDITTGASPCTTTMVANTNERLFVANGIPANPWSGSAAASTTAVTACAGTGCAHDGTKSCAGAAAYANTDGGWCYDPTVGTIWANSGNNGTAAPNGEYSF